MNRGTCVGRFLAWLRFSSWIAGALLLTSGCAQQTQQARLKSEDENERDKYQFQTIRDVANFDRIGPVVVGGVGLITGLNGTGSDAPPGDHRAMLEKQLNQMGISQAQAKAMLSSKDTAMVVVSAKIPPGRTRTTPWTWSSRCRPTVKPPACAAVTCYAAHSTTTVSSEVKPSRATSASTRRDSSWWAWVTGTNRSA